MGERERVTLWREEGGGVGIVQWKDRNLATREELTPRNASVVVYTEFCKETISIIMGGGKKDRDEFVNDFLP